MGGGKSKPKLEGCVLDTEQKCNLNKIIWGGEYVNDETPSLKVCNSDSGICRSVQTLVNYLEKESYVEFRFDDEASGIINSNTSNTDDISTSQASESNNQLDISLHS